MSDTEAVFAELSALCPRAGFLVHRHGASLALERTRYRRFRLAIIPWVFGLNHLGLHYFTFHGSAYGCALFLAGASFAYTRAFGAFTFRPSAGHMVMYRGAVLARWDDADGGYLRRRARHAVEVDGVAWNDQLLHIGVCQDQGTYEGATAALYLVGESSVVRLGFFPERAHAEAAARALASFTGVDVISSGETYVEIGEWNFVPRKIRESKHCDTIWAPVIVGMPLVVMSPVFSAIVTGFASVLGARVIDGRTVPPESDVLSWVSRPTGVLLVLAIFVLLIWVIERYRTEDVSDWTATLFPDHGVPNFRTRRQSKLNLSRK